MTVALFIWFRDRLHRSLGIASPSRFYWERREDR
jgi:hypothetical protein